MKGKIIYGRSEVGKWKGHRMKPHILVTVFLITITWVTLVESLAVMSVDLGSEWMKVGIVSPGVPMEIALNKESKRKTPAVISFRDNVRLFGEDAQNIGVSFPKQAYGYLFDLLGKSINHPLVKLYQERFPYYEIVENPETGTILFKHDEENVYSPEELIAQFLVKAREFAENGAHQPIKECVITVPGFFNQVERRALLQAAEMAGLKVLQLINDYTAVAINYGIFRSKTFNETSQYVIFYDMGASSTSATLVSYQTVKTKERGYVETHPQASILGVGYDRTLGGLEIQIRLRDYLAKKFNEMKKTKNDVFKNSRAMAKLFKEAGRLKNVLSANTEHYAQIEGLLDEQDFKLIVKREEMEALIKDLLDRVGKPVELALKTAHLTMDVVSQVILVGAGTRVPKVQEYLQKAVGQELSKNINADEAAALGAVYRAADLSTGFKVAKFITKDAVLFPIQVMFERETEEGLKLVKRTLFGLMNPYPQKKIITFNKHTEDFSFSVNYIDLDYLPSNEIINVGSTNLSEYKLTGVAEAIKKNTGDNTELKGSTFSKLFGGEDQKPIEEKPTEEKPTEEEEAAEEQKPTEKDKEKQDSPKDSAKKSNATEPIKSTEQILTINTLNEKQFSESLKKLKKLDKIESEINRRATALNNLESFVIDIQNKLEEDEYAKSGTTEELEKIRVRCGEISDWLYDDGSDADADTYEKKLDELHALTRELFSRVWEHKERPEALNALEGMLNHSSHFLANARNLTKTTNPEKDVFTDVEVDTLEKLINDTVEWRRKVNKEQEALEKHEPPKLTVKNVNGQNGWLRQGKKEKPVQEKSENVTGKSKDEETIDIEPNEETIEVPESENEEKVEPTTTEKSEDSHTEL
ncbi:hypothetical protein NQ317_012719 [Molorchus minor]|uniref:Hypoxia up-regulated protein 1 n=1 Tax=Molorchus minor TaxID=1323400 RepID=A0ABQ9IXV7_9CUCU|nr:hypothetical protein NQ317_012719 [Molorchus minor]